MASSKGWISWIITVTVKEDKKARAEELWQLTIDDIKSNEKGRVDKSVLFDEENNVYIVREDYASEEIMLEYRNKPYHEEISNKVKSEGLLTHWPEPHEVRKCKVVMQ